MKAYARLKQLEFVAAALLLSAVLGLMGWASITRFLGVPNIWVIEITQVLFAWVCLLAASIAFRRSQHFSVDILSSILPTKLAARMGTIRYAILLCILLGIAWISIDYVELAHRRRLALTGIRYSWVAAALPVSCVLMSFNCIDKIYRGLRAQEANN